MTTTDALPLKTLDPAHVSRVVRALLIEADRDILVEDGPRRDLVSIPFDAAAAEDGLLPVFLVAAEAIWRDVTGRGFDLTLKRDLGALMSWRIEAIRAEAFSCVLLSVMEAIATVAGAHGVMVLDLARRRRAPKPERRWDDRSGYQSEGRSEEGRKAILRSAGARGVGDRAYGRRTGESR